MSASDRASATPSTARSLALVGNQNAAKPLIVEEHEYGCQVPVSHARNAYGYPIKRFRDAGKSTPLILHREVFRQYHGITEFPADTDVDHLCERRDCISPNHLQTLSRSEHMRKTSRDVQSTLEANARMFWMLTRCNAADLKTTFRLGLNRATEWVEAWQQADARNAARMTEEAAEISPVS